jgi:hypothetical protein
LCGCMYTQRRGGGIRVNQEANDRYQGGPSRYDGLGNHETYDMVVRNWFDLRDGALAECCFL